MELEKYISSGILELYVYGALPEEESLKVTQELKQHPEILKEVEEIEAALTQLSISVAPYNPEALLYTIQQKITEKQKAGVIEHPAKPRKTNLVLYIGWAASIALLIGLVSVISDRNALRESLEAANVKNTTLEQQISDARQSAEKNKQLLEVFRDKEINNMGDNEFNPYLNNPFQQGGYGDIMDESEINLDSGYSQEDLQKMRENDNEKNTHQFDRQIIEYKEPESLPNTVTSYPLLPSEITDFSGSSSNKNIHNKKAA